MRVLCRTAALAVVAALGAATPAFAAEYCVGVHRAGCTQAETLADALALAADGDTVHLGSGEHAAPSTAVATAVSLLGAGDGVRIVAAPAAARTLELTSPSARLAGVEVRPPAGGQAAVRSAGALSAIRATAPDGGTAVELLSRARLADSIVEGPVVAGRDTRIERTTVEAGAGTVALTAGDGDGPAGRVDAEDVVIRAGGASAALAATCAITLVARHLTITGTAAVAAAASGCEGDQAATGTITLESTLVTGGIDDVGDGPVASRHSAHAEDPDVEAADRLDVADPRLDDDLRPLAGSPLVDAGDPSLLTAGEGSFDRTGHMRIVDGDGDRVARRDVGALELQPPSPPLPEANVLANPGAEVGEDAGAELVGPQPPGWTRLGGDITAVPYGTVLARPGAGDIVLPTAATGEALGAGRSFFSGGGTLLQRVDLNASARAVDTGNATVALSGLLGGFAADADTVRVEAGFVDPEGKPLGQVTLGPVAPGERANATGLVHRAGFDRIPQRTRAIDVRIVGTRLGGSYTDAYADNLSLALSVPAAPVEGPVDPGDPPVTGLKPFAGVTVLSPRLFLTRPGQVRVRLGCASATVGGCRGILELHGRPRRARPAKRIARFARVELEPGEAATVAMPLIRAHLRVLRKRKRFPATLRATVRDGQGVQRARTVPLRVLRSRRW